MSMRFVLQARAFMASSMAAPICDDKSPTRVSAFAAHAALSSQQQPRTLAGEATTVTPAARRAAILSLALPLPPEMMAPAWPMRRPGGAVKPAMNDTMGLVVLHACGVLAHALSGRVAQPVERTKAHTP
jgi:hypothetical protein